MLFVKIDTNETAAHASGGDEAEPNSQNGSKTMPSALQKARMVQIPATARTWG
jgi:hypothetical protein